MNKSRARLTCHSHASLAREHRTMIGLLRSFRRPFSFRRSVPQTRTPTISSHLSSVCRVEELPSQSKIQKLYGTAFSWAFFLHPRREYSRENGQRAKGKGQRFRGEKYDDCASQKPKELEWEYSRLETFVHEYNFIYTVEREKSGCGVW